MKKNIMRVGLPALCLLFLASFANAAIIACGPPPPPALAVATVGAGTSSFSYTCDGLTFNNFLITDAGNTPAGTVLDLTGAFLNTSTNDVVLGFNPNIAASEVSQDFHLTFEVTGGVSQIDMTLGGASSSATERVCSQQLTAESMLSGNCNSPSQQLAVITTTSATGTVNSSGFPSTSPIFIFKDINVAAGTELTSFSESFVHVPEPMTLSLMGVGLLGLGFLGRRRATK